MFEFTSLPTALVRELLSLSGSVWVRGLEFEVLKAGVILEYSQAGGFCFWYQVNI